MSKTVIEMAREAGIDEPGSDWLYWKAMERLVELARADEREKYKWDIHSCGPTCKRYACVATREAIAAEREACAKLCDEQKDRSLAARDKSKRVTDGRIYHAAAQTAAWNAAAIRARGQA